MTTSKYFIASDPIENEKGLLSSILQFRPALKMCQEKGVNSSCFLQPEHAIIFRTLASKFCPASAEGLKDVLVYGGFPKTDVDYVDELYEFVPTHLNAEYYADLVLENKLNK